MKKDFEKKEENNKKKEKYVYIYLIANKKIDQINLTLI